MPTWIQKSVFVFLSLGFALTSAAAPRAPSRPSDDNLTQAFAQFRRAQVQSVEYDLHFVLNKGSDEFKGKAVLGVELARTDAPLSIELLWKKIDAVRVNGKPVTDFVTRKGSFDVPAKYLAKSNKIEVEYTNDFNKEGRGFMRSVDPEDGAEYVFSDFEPYDAHWLFPCFDQPDLKAVYRVTVDAPSDWRVVSNELVQEAKPAGERTLTRFVPTKPLSTYLFFLGAGPFAEWTDKAGDVPLFIWARKSLAKHMDAARIFETTKKGLAFFNDYFGYPYPFSKYGQIFVPEFMSSGMENPGAVTLNERFIFRGPVPQSRFEGRDSLILHEMAHMWFGDLVTMNWWNDLWLNESFASYLATVSQDRAMQAKGTWLDSFSGKTWGYWQDQLVTTHPIETPVPDVRTSKGNFDGITYAKGAASLQQLHFFVGEEGFREGLRSYFKKYAFKNTSRENFISEIAKASKQDLKGWTKAWLQTAGPNRVEAKWNCDGGAIKSFALLQQPSSSKTLSPHRTRVGLFKSGANGTLELTKSQNVFYSKASTDVPELKGQACPDFVYPNLDDQDYALFSLDPASLKVAKQGLTGGITQPLLRLQIWSTLAQMVRDTKLPVMEYFDLGLAGLEKENEGALLGILLGRHSQIRDAFYRYLTPVQRKTVAPRFEDVIWKRVSASEPGSSLQMQFFDFYVTIAQTPQALAQLNGFLKGESVPNGIQVDQDRRWEVVKALAFNGFAQANELIDAEEKKDPSTSGKRHAYAARAAVPALEVKKRFWAEIEKAEQIPFSSLRMATDTFHNPNNTALTEALLKPYFARVTEMDWQAHDNLVGIYLENLFPHNICSRQLLSESQAQMKKAKKMTPIARRAWLEANDELSKCVAIRSVR